MLLLPRIRILLVCPLLLLCACAATQKSTDHLFKIVEFTAPLETQLKVDTGNAVFVQGTYIQGEEINLSKDVSLLVPGAMFIPFPVSIKAGSLPMTRIEGEWKYYCASMSGATATFPGLGSVVANGDCIGLRQSLTSGEYEWVVDNSIHNRSNTIWTKSFDESYKALVSRRMLDKPYQVRELTRIVFDGLAGGQYRFTLEELSGNTKTEKSFVFDRAQTGDTVVGIKGRVFRIIKADNVSMEYAWVKL